MLYKYSIPNNTQQQTCKVCGYPDKFNYLDKNKRPPREGGYIEGSNVKGNEILQSCPFGVQFML